MPPVGLVHLDAGRLSAQVGGDPWLLNDELQRGDAGAIDELADAFHRSGNRVEEADDDFRKAKEQFKSAYVRNGSEHPIDESGEVTRTTAAMKGHREQLSQVAVNLEQCAAALARAQRDGDATIANLDQKLHVLDDQMGNAIAAGQNTGPLRLAAAGAVQEAVKAMEMIRGNYAGQLHAAETAMMDSGYVPDALDDVDGMPGDAYGDAARRYDESGQRARDQAMVEKAMAAGASDSTSLVGKPGGLTVEESDAAQRLHDFKVVNDQRLNDPGRGAGEVHDRAQERRLAGERLEDYDMLHSSGPVAVDPVLGGDARNRAQARLDLQRKLESGTELWQRGHVMTPDEATHTIDQMEASDRASVLANLPQQLQENGMSPDGAARVVEGLIHGRIPDEYINGVQAGGKFFDGGKEGFHAYAEAVPTGKHWAPGVAFSPEDVEALKKLGSRVGAVGSLVELGTAAYELAHGKPIGEVAAKAAGGMAGAWMLGQVGAGAGAFIAGPPGAFVGALTLGTVGAFYGEDIGEGTYKWLAE